MFTISRSFRRIGLKLRYRTPFFVQFLIILFVFVVLFNKFVLERQFHQRKRYIHNDLLDYNEDGLRPHWKFKIPKHYDMNDLRSYNSKSKFISGSNLPGEGGDLKFILIN